MTTPAQDLAARPAFAGLLARLRGGEGPCRCLRTRGRVKYPQAACRDCGGSGRVAVPPDPDAALVLADWWQDAGGDLAGLLWCYALGAPEWRFPPGRLPPGWHTGLELHPTAEGGYLLLPPEQDDSLRPVLCAWDAFACPARAAAARGLRLVRDDQGRWWLEPDESEPAGPFYAEADARLALKRAALACYDPGNPFDGGAGVLAPCPACEGDGWADRLAGNVCHPCGGRGWVKPSSLPPAAADAGGRTPSGARHVRVDLGDLRR